MKVKYVKGPACDNGRFVRETKKKKYTDKMQITIDCNRAAAERLEPLLKQIQIMGNIGSSRTIRIENWSDRKEDWAQDKFYFDGDGPDCIDEIKVKEK